MSAYTASAPVIASTTVPSARNDIIGCAAKNNTPYHGFKDLRMVGYSWISASPSTPSTTNQSIITGPNTAPTRAVPLRWNANNPKTMTSVTGTTYCSKAGAATLRPSTAPRIDIAGVITPSP